MINLVLEYQQLRQTLETVRRTFGLRSSQEMEILSKMEAIWKDMSDEEIQTLEECADA